jgi:hypothetical protein
LKETNLLAYSDMDNFILEKWEDVNRLVDARYDVESRIEKVIVSAGERVRSWIEPLGYALAVQPRDAIFHIHRANWEIKRKEPAVTLALGGFCPPRYRKDQDPYPSLWVHTAWLEGSRIKEPERRTLAAEIRSQLGPVCSDWSEDICDDLKYPLVHYLREYDTKRRCALVASVDNLYNFTVREFPRLFAIADVVDQSVQKLLKK